MTDREKLASRIERLRRCYVSLLEETPGAVPARASWELEERTLCWHVALGDVLEPDIDVEVMPDAIVVRASVERRVRQTLLPVPPPFHPRRPVVRFVAGVLVVRVGRGQR